MSGMTIEYTFHRITSYNACHVDLYYCFISGPVDGTNPALVDLVDIIL